jgi:hypothetical protein
MTDQKLSVSVATSVEQLRTALKATLKYEPNLIGTAAHNFPTPSTSARNNVNAMILRMGLDSVLDCAEVDLTGRDDEDAVFLDIEKRPDADNEQFFEAMEALQKRLDAAAG